MLILCGAVGSGKSTLLAALAGARPLAAGARAATPRRAYVAQQPFLMRESLRRNVRSGMHNACTVHAPCTRRAAATHPPRTLQVLFGQPFEPKRYERALVMAALEPDLLALPRGDETDVGEGGHALSGGQRARVAFARAVYAEAEARSFGGHACTMHMRHARAMRVPCACHGRTCLRHGTRWRRLARGGAARCKGL